MTEQVSNIYKAWLKESAKFPKHEECKPGEIWICNVSFGDEIKWSSARLGQKAFNKIGELLPGYFPIFVKENEVKSAFNVVNFHGKTVDQIHAGKGVFRQ
jgi:hypothetical protein